MCRKKGGNRKEVARLLFSLKSGREHGLHRFLIPNNTRFLTQWLLINSDHVTSRTRQSFKARRSTIKASQTQSDNQSVNVFDVWESILSKQPFELSFKVTCHQFGDHCTVHFSKK